MLSELCGSIAFLNATGHSINKTRMKDHYVVLRAIAFMMYFRGAFENMPSLQYRGDIDDFLARFMVYINEEVSEDILNQYARLFIHSMSVGFDLLGEDGFRFEGNKVRRPINMPLFESLAYLFSYCPTDMDNRSRSWLLGQIDQVKSLFDRSNYFTGNIDSTTSVAFRFDHINNIVKELR